MHTQARPRTSSTTPARAAARLLRALRPRPLPPPAPPPPGDELAALRYQLDLLTQHVRSIDSRLNALLLAAAGTALTLLARAFTG